MCDYQRVSALCDEWLASKRIEAEANARRLEIEKEICTIARGELPSEGTAKLGKLKVATGFTRSWDTDQLTQIYRNKPPIFPFKVDWKEDRRLTSKLEDTQPEVMALFATALTIKEKKPSFTFVGE